MKTNTKCIINEVRFYQHFKISYKPVLGLIQGGTEEASPRQNPQSISYYHILLSLCLSFHIYTHGLPSCLTILFPSSNSVCMFCYPMHAMHSDHLTLSDLINPTICAKLTIMKFSPFPSSVLLDPNFSSAVCLQTLVVSFLL